jgi:pimeloyl-ACP methyl ester carboxylesterase
MTTETANRVGSNRLRTVLCIHGINTTGKWQEDIKSVLRPFFEPVAIKYRHYRWLGVLKIFLEPWVALGGLAVIFLLQWHGWPPGWPPWAVVLVGVVISLMLAWVAAPIRRRCALKSVIKQANLYMAHQKPHIIAHSFGTYLICTALRQYPASRARRVVLLGCVLASRWEWAKLLQLKRDAFHEIRNEWTNSDWVVRLARWVRIPGFGRAGILRFEGSPDLIHDVTHPTQLCISCETGAIEAALIHNIDCSGLGHSDAFLGPAHAERFWLPYLWGIDPAEYVFLLDLCENASKQEDLGNMPKLAVVEDELLECHWRWTHNPLLTFRQCIEELVRRDPSHIGKSMDELVGRIVHVFWRTVEDARKARAGPNLNEGMMIYLHPLRALVYAVNRILSSP